MPPVIINQGMKRQPMAVYRIREVLSGNEQDRDYPQCVDDKDQPEYEGHEASLSSKSPASQSEAGARGYEDGLPVEDFLTKEQRLAVKEGEQ